MTSQDESQPRSPFSRPGFVVAAVVVGAILVAGVVLGIINATRAGDEPPTTNPTATETPEPSTTTPAPTAEPTDSASICGLDDGGSNGTLSSAPETDWQFQGTTAYPTSPVYGPGAADEDGFRYCFQRSPQGALFMAANAVPQGSDPSASSAWVDYALAEGPYREQLLGEMSGSPATDGTRLSIVGFRLLHYDGRTARVDLAVRGTAEGQTATLSGVYELVWQQGDWRISADVSEPLDMAAIPDAAGYISWTE